MNIKTFDCFFNWLKGQHYSSTFDTTFNCVKITVSKDSTGNCIGVFFHKKNIGYVSDKIFHDHISLMKYLPSPYKRNF